MLELYFHLLSYSWHSITPSCCFSNTSNPLLSQDLCISRFLWLEYASLHIFTRLAPSYHSSHLFFDYRKVAHPTPQILLIPLPWLSCLCSIYNYLKLSYMKFHYIVHVFMSFPLENKVTRTETLPWISRA